MTWDYRTFKTEDGYSVREVFYKDNGDIDTWTTDDCSPFGETETELVRDLAHMIKAMSRPTIDLTGGKPK